MTLKKVISLPIILAALLPPIQPLNIDPMPRFESDKTPEIERGPIGVPGASKLVPDFFPLPPTSGIITDIEPENLGRNLIPNPGLEETDSSGLPTSWHKGGYGTNTRIFSYPVTTNSSNGVSVAITSYTGGDAKWNFDHVPVKANATYSFSDQFKSSAPSIVTIEYILSDGSKIYKDVLFLNPSAAFNTANVTFTTPANVISLSIFHLLNTVGELTTDDYSLIEGNIDNNYVPNPGFESGVTDPNSWNKGKWGQHSAAFSYPVSGSGGGRAARVDMAGHRTGDAKWYTDPIRLKAGTYIYSDEYIANVPTFITIQFRHADGSITYKDIAQPQPSPSWNKESIKFDVPFSVVDVTIFHLINQNGSLTIDNVSIKDSKDQTRIGVFTTGAVTIRFDDNWLSQYVNAIPILENKGLSSTLYVVSQQIADNNFSGYMSRAQIKDAFAKGHEIGAHTRTHRDLATLSSNEQIDEIKGSRTDLLSWEVGPIRSFAYPYGSYKTETIQIVKEAGFDSAAATIIGLVSPDSDPYQLERKGLDKNTTFKEVKQWIDQVKAEKNWLILAAHQVESKCPDFYCITTPVFQQIINYLASSSIPVITVSEALDSLK